MSITAQESHHRGSAGMGCQPQVAAGTRLPRQGKTRRRRRVGGDPGRPAHNRMESHRFGIL